MKIKQLSFTLALALALTSALLISFTLAAPGNPFSDPRPNTHTASPDTTVALTYDEAISAATVTSHTFAVHAFQTGLLTATHGVQGNTIIVTPTRPFHVGELVQTTATTRTLSIIGEQPLSYTVWGFRAGASGGGGIFAPHPLTLTLPGLNNSRDLALGDLDGDGDLDAVVANENQAQNVYLNDGGGGFQAGPQFGSADSDSRAVNLGDVDGDGDLDAVVVNTNSQSNTVHLNDGHGIFIAHPVSPTFDVGSSGWDSALGDVDGDGDLDAIVVGGSNHKVYLNDGSGGFYAHPAFPTFGGSASNPIIVLGDLDGDGDLDAVIANDSNDAERVYLNNGRGGFAEHAAFGAGISSNAVALGDVEGDGDLDIVVANWNAAQDVYLNVGGGNFIEHPSAPHFGGGASTDVVLGDVDGDGDLDAIVSNGFQGQTVYLKDRAAAFAEHSTFGSASLNRAVALGDLDGDGDLDVVVANAYGEGDVWLNQSRADLSITKTVEPAIAVPGAPITYTLTFLNNGPNATTHIVISDSVPVSVVLGGAWAVSSGEITRTAGVTFEWTVSRLGPGEGGVITITGWLSDALPHAHTFTNTATITGAVVDTDTLNNEGTASITVDAQAPDAPTLLSPADGALISDTTPALTWQASAAPDVAGYLLDLNGAASDVGNVTVYTTPLLADGAYTWTVAAYDGVDNTSPYADIWSFSVDTQAPDAPVLLSPADGALISDTTPALTWQASAAPDVAGYLLDLNGAVSDVGNVTVYTTSILADGAYTWTVAAYDEASNTSAYTDTWSFTVDAEVPGAPVLLSPADGALISNATPALTWQASAAPDVAGYLLDLNGAASDVGNVTVYTTPILADGAYTWTVAAYDEPGNTSPYADAWSFTVDTQSPGAPTLLSPADGALISDTTPALTWQASAAPDVAGYLLDLNGAVSDVGNVTVYTTPILADGAYTWTVAAYDEAGNTSAYAGVWSFAVEATSPQVTGFSPADGAQDVALDAVLVITFSEPVRADSLSYLVTPDPGGWSATWGRGTVLLPGGGTATTPGGSVVTLTHDVSFDLMTVYNITVSAAMDGAGNPLSGAPYEWSFATLSTRLYLPIVLFSDTILPTVRGVVPPDGAQGVALDAALVITFSETISTTSLVYSVTPDPGGWSAIWSDSDTMLTLHHDDFGFDTIYTVTLTAADDLAGNPLSGAPYEWSFETLLIWRHPASVTRRD